MVAQRTTDTHFEQELVKRFFNPRSYFFLCVSEHLRERRPLDEPGAEEEYSLVAALMDRLVNAEDPRAELLRLASNEPFAEYVRILDESVARFRSEALPPQKLKAAIENVAVLFLDATLACLEDDACRADLLATLGLPAGAPETGTVSPDVAFAGEKKLEPEPVNNRFEEEVFLASYFRRDVSEEFRKVEDVGQSDLQKARAYLSTFYNVRDLAMIHGEEDIETLCAKMAELLRRELSRGEIRPEVLSLADRVRHFVENSLEQTDPEQVRVLVGILQDALAGRMPEIVMAVDLEETAEPEAEPGEWELAATESPAREPSGVHNVSPEAAARPPSVASVDEFKDQSAEQSPSPEPVDTIEMTEQTTEAPPEGTTGSTSEEPDSAAVPEGTTAEKGSPAEPSLDQETQPEWGFAEMVGIEDLLDLDEETESLQETPGSPSPSQVSEAVTEAEDFAKRYEPEQETQSGPAEPGTPQEPEFRLPGEDDEELLALIREVRNHAERISQSQAANEHAPGEAAEAEPPLPASPNVPASTGIGYGPHAQEAALYLQVMRTALNALRSDPAKHSALEDLDLAASSLKRILNKLGDTKLWAVPSALSAATTVLREQGLSADAEFLEAANEALVLLETGPAPAVNGKIAEVVQKFSRLQGSQISGQTPGNGRAPGTTGKKAQRPPFRLRGRRHVEESRHQPGL